MNPDYFLFFVWLIVLLWSLGMAVLFAWIDGWLYPSQTDIGLNIHGQDYQDYALVQHGGLWASVLLISWWTAYLADSYHPVFLSTSGLAAALVAVTVAGLMVLAYSYQSARSSDGLFVDGKTMMAGRFFLVFTSLVIWVMLMVYFGRTAIQVSRGDLLLSSSILSLFFLLGNVKFSEGWKWRTRDTVQAGSLIAFTWIATLVEL